MLVKEYRDPEVLYPFIEVLYPFIKEQLADDKMYYVLLDPDSLDK